MALSAPAKDTLDKATLKTVSSTLNNQLEVCNQLFAHLRLVKKHQSVYFHLATFQPIFFP